MGALITIAALTAVLVLVQEVTRRSGPWVVAVLYLTLPLALTAYWLRTNDYGPFPWIKVYTVLFCACFGTALRFTALSERATARVLITAFLAVNILEAATLDVLGGGLAHALNAVAGFVLIATLPRGSDAVQIATSGRRRELHYYGMSRLWIVGYTVWNWAFVSLNYPEFAGHHVAVLFSALVVGLIDPRRWLHARAYTLGAYFIVLLTFPELLGTSDWSDPQVSTCAAVAAVLVAIGCALQYRTAAARSRLTRPHSGGQWRPLPDRILSLGVFSWLPRLPLRPPRS